MDLLQARRWRPRAVFGANRWHRCGVMVVWMTTVGAEAASSPPTVVSVPAETPIKVDGVLDEPTWRSGGWSEGFTLLSEAPKVPQVATRFKFRHDDRCLYLGAVLDEPAVKRIRADASKRDGQVWHDDCLELMIDPTGQRVEYYHFAVNSRGTIYDAWGRQGGHVQTAEWDSTATAAARVDERAWTVELAIPLNELGLTEASLGAWAVNVARERQAGTRELSTFAPLQGGFHQPTRYARMELERADLHPYLWQLSPPFELKIVRQASRLICTGKVRVVNQTGRSRSFLLRPVLVTDQTSRRGEAVGGELFAKKGRELSFRIPLAVQGPQLLRLIVSNRAKPDQVWAVRATPLDLRYEPLKLSLLEPGYRDSIYATQKLDRIVVRCDLDEDPAVLTGSRLRVRLVRQDGTAVGEQKLDAKRGGHEVRLPADDLPVGDHQIEAEVLGADGKTLFSARRRVRKLPPVPHEWRLDNDGVLLHNGEPFLPFGWFSISRAEMAKPDCPYTAMQAYSSYWFSTEKVREFLDEVAEAKTVITIYPYPNPDFVRPADKWGLPLTDKEAADLRQRVRALKTHPALMAWYMADEPELRPALPERCRRIYEVVADEDPYHPCIMLNDTIAGVGKYVEGGDILMPDPYPLFIKGGRAAQPIEKVTQFMQACRQAGKGRKGIWITPQAFNYGDYGRANNRAPSLTEMRNMTYQAAIGGAKGWLWYTFGHSQNYPSLGIGMPFLAREALDLTDALLAPDVADAIEVKAQLPAHLHACVRRAHDHWYVFMLNTATQAQEVQFRLKPADSPGRLHVISEDRPLSASSKGAFKDRFEPYATHLYTTDPKLFRRQGLAEIQAEIRQADRARRRPGNLAFEDFGTKVTFSSKSQYGSTPDRVVDGVRGGMKWQDGTKGQWPDWLAVEWPKPVELARVVVFSQTVRDAKVQGRSAPDAEWQDLASAADATGDHFEVTFPAATVRAIRVFVTANRAGQESTQMTEVEAYGPK